MTVSPASTSNTSRSAAPAVYTPRSCKSWRPAGPHAALPHKMATAVRDIQYKDNLLALAADDTDESEITRELNL